MKRGAELSGSDNNVTYAIKNAIPLNDDVFEKIKSLIDEGASVNSKTSDGYSPLSLIIFASHFERKKIVNYLIEKGANLEEKQPFNLLHEAIIRNNKEILSVLLKNGANPNAKSNGFSPLHLTCSDLEFSNLKDCTRRCRNAKDCANPKECFEVKTKLSIAKSKLKMAEKLLKKKADPNALCNGMTPLHYLCHHNANEQFITKFVTLLIERGANLETLYDGMTPLQHAIIKNRKEMIQILIEKGAKIDVEYHGKSLIELIDKPEDQSTLAQMLKSKHPKLSNDEIFIKPKKIKKNDVQLALRLFANIFNTFKLSESNVLGVDLHQAAEYLQDFIKRLDNKIDKEIATRCQELLATIIVSQSRVNYKIEDFMIKFIDINILKPIEEIIDQKKRMLEERRVMLIEMFVTEFEQKRHILIPGRWLGSSFHHMVYEFKEDQNNCLFLIWNTGPGLEFHLFEDSADKRRHYPVKAYRMPSYSNLDKETFKQYLSLLLDYKNIYSNHQLYNEIIPNIAILNGEEFEPVDFKNHKIEESWSSTSSLQVLIKIIHYYGFKSLSIDEFQCEVMQDGFENFASLLTDEDYQREDVASQLQNAIRNFAVFLKKMTLSDGGTSRKEKGLNLIKVISGKLENEPVFEIKEADFKFNANDSLTIPPRLSSIHKKLFEESDQENIPFRDYKQIMHFEKVCALALKGIFQSILNEPAENTNARCNILRRIEQILFTLPNNQAYWETLSHQEIKELINLLPYFAEKYYNLCQTLNYHYAENIIGLRICYGLGWTLAKIMDPAIVKEENSILNLRIRGGIDKLISQDSSLEGEMASEYFTITQDNVAQSIHHFKLPILNLDNWLADIPQKSKTLTKEAYENYKSFQGAIEAHQVDISNVTEQKIPAMYYFLKRQQSDYLLHDEKIEHKYNEIENHFQNILSVLALKNFYHWGLGGFIAQLKKIPPNKWELVKLKRRSMVDISLKLTLAQRRHSKNIGQSHEINNKEITEELKKSIYSNQQIEVRYHSTIPSEKIDYLRRLAHVRSAPEGKIVASIEFIKSSLVYFDNKDLQTCLFLFLFQGENLSKEIKLNPKAIDQLLDCIEDGIKYFKKQELLFSVLFFYKLNTFLNQFLINTKDNELQEYQSWIKKSFKLNNDIESLFYERAYKHNKTHQDITVLNVINYLYLIHLYNFHTYFGALSNEQWHHFFISNCFLSQLPIENLYPFVNKEINKAADALRCASLDKECDHTPILRNICTLFNVQLNESKIKRSFPFYYQDDNYAIDLLNGVLIQRGLKEEILPQAFYDSCFKTLFHEGEINARKINVNSYEFTYKKSAYRVGIQGNITIIQKNHFDKWFQLLNSEQLIKFGKSNDKMCLPVTLVDETNFVWQSQDGFYLFTERASGKLQYLYNADIGTLYKLNAQEKLQWTLNREIFALDVITKFEDPAFIEVWQNLETKEVNINLPRYGLQFYFTPDVTPLQVMCKEYENYQLTFNKTIPIKNFKNALILEPIDAESKLETLYLIPKQVFIPSKEMEGNALELDLRNIVKSTAYLKLKWENVKGEISQSELEKVEPDPDKNNYQNQEQFAIYTKDGELKTQNLVDQFYLAYLYFGKGEIKKCYNLLKSLVHVVTGNEEELVYLRYIITETPCQILDKDRAKLYTNNSPEYLAIRLFALYILVVYLKNGQEKKIQPKNNIKGEVNIQADKFQKKALEKFIDKIEFQDFLKNTLSQYLIKEKVIPKAMRLRNAQLLTLFSSFNSVDQKILKEKQTQFLSKRLSKEYHALCDLAAYKLNSLQQIRKALIEKELKALNESALNYTPLAMRIIKPLKGIAIENNSLIPSKLFRASADHPFFEILANKMNDDLSMGEKINSQIKDQNESYYLKFNELTRSILFEKTNNEFNLSKGILDLLKKEIEITINAGTANDPLLWELDKYTHSIKTLTIDDALYYFAKYHLNKIQEKRALSSQSAQDLFEKIHLYLIEGTKQQKYARIIKKLGEIDKCKDEHTKKHLIHQLGAIVSQERCYNSRKFPEILVFEYLDNKLIYKMQYRIIKKLHEKNDKNIYISTVIKLIMGAGKSKIILPLLARLRPDGTNLTVIEVPAELFETYLHDLFSTSRKLGQKLFPFRFHRNMQCDAHYFYQLKEEFRSIIADKNYILTTKNSMDSLMLKYIDLLTHPEESQEWKNQVEYLGDIINILKKQGDCISDEIDLTLNPKDQLIYTIGEGKSIEKHLLLALVSLYDFLPSELFSIINGESCRPESEILDKLFSELTSVLITSPYSPLYPIVNKLNEAQAQQILDYLQNKVTLPSSKQLTDHERDILALYKEELTRLLPLSIKKDCNVHYGLPNDETKDPLALEIAIPFLGSNKPNKLAHFQSPFLRINYTIQVQLRNYLSYYIFETFIQNFKKKYELESIFSALYNLPVNAAQIEFEQLINRTDIKLNEINFDDKTQMKDLHSQLKNMESIKKYCLTEFILPSILNNTVTLASDAQNHVDIYRSMVGFTGTDFIFRTFPDEFELNQAESFGTDGQTIDNILKATPNQKAYLMQQDKFDEIFDMIDKHPKREEMRAIIDCGAVFKGVSNREVANKLSYQFSQDAYKNCDIKYIIYFNEENTLCAISSSKTPEKEKSIMLGGTEAIDEKLGCTMGQRITYYSHTTGVDIEQAPNTIGFLTLSEHTTLRDLIQGAMRLRDLKGTHLIEFVVLKSLASAYPQINWDTINILNVALLIQTKFLMNCHLTSAMQKIRNVFRSDLINCIRTAPAIDTKTALAASFKKYLYDFDNLSFFDKYGAPETSIETIQYLLNYQEEMLKKWLTCFEDEQVLETLKIKLIKDCSKIIENVIPICEYFQKSNASNNSENQVIAQNERQQEQELQQEMAPNTKTSVGYLSWKNINWEEWYPHAQALVPCYSLDKELDMDRNWHFSDNLYLSYNFLNTCKEVHGALNTFSKPGCFMLVIMYQNNLNHVLITESEAAEIRQSLSAKNIWVETVSGVPYGGYKPNLIEESSSYQINVEQLQYFNGDLPYLISKGEKLEWFKQYIKEKMDFLEKILRYHPSKKPLLDILKKIFKLDTKELKKPLVPYEDFDKLQNTLLYRPHKPMNEILQNSLRSGIKCVI